MKRLSMIALFALLTISADRPQSFGNIDFWTGSVLRYHVQVDPYFPCGQVTYVTITNLGERPTAHFRMTQIDVYPCVGDVFSKSDIYVLDGMCTQRGDILVALCNSNAPPALFADGRDVTGSPWVKYLDSMTGYTYLPMVVKRK